MEDASIWIQKLPCSLTVTEDKDVDWRRGGHEQDQVDGTQNANISP